VPQIGISDGKPVIFAHVGDIVYSPKNHPFEGRITYVGKYGVKVRWIVPNGQNWTEWVLKDTLGIS